MHAKKSLKALSARISPLVLKDSFPENQIHQLLMQLKSCASYYCKVVFAACQDHAPQGHKLKYGHVYIIELSDFCYLLLNSFPLYKTSLNTQY